MLTPPHRRPLRVLAACLPALLCLVACLPGRIGEPKPARERIRPAGIDRALVVRGHVREVMGCGKVHFYDATRKPAEGEPDYVAVGAGERYDLAARRVLEAAKSR